MRAAAALAVLSHHIADEGAHFWGMDENSSLRHFIKGGMIGVDLFFILSGFIMTHISMKENKPRVFFYKRIARIVPTYWFYITLTLIATVALSIFKRSSEERLSYIISSYLFFPAANSKGKIFPLLDIGWTLNFEMFFYAIFSLSLFIKNRSIRLKSLLAFLLFFSILGYFIPAKYIALKFWSDQIILEFGLGMIIAMLYDQKVKISSNWKWILITTSVIFECIVTYYSRAIDEYRFFLWGIPAAVSLAAGMLGEREGAHSKLYMWMFKIGTVSYSLYLVHPFIIRLVTVMFLKFGLVMPALWIPATLIMFIAAIIAARLSDKYIEFPSQRVVRHWLKVK